MQSAVGPLLTNYQYENIGVPINIVLLADEGSVYDGNDLGLDYVVGGENGKFKVPTLRNVVRTAPYSHNGYFPTLYDIVAFLNSLTDSKTMGGRGRMSRSSGPGVLVCPDLQPPQKALLFVVVFYFL